MGTELDLDDVAAQSNMAIAELAELRTQLAILKRMIDCAPRAVSAGADFEQTQSVRVDCRVRHG